VVDGGFGMGQNLPWFAVGESDFFGQASDVVTTSDGASVAVPQKADFGTLSSGGLY